MYIYTFNNLALLSSLFARVLPSLPVCTCKIDLLGAHLVCREVQCTRKSCLTEWKIGANTRRGQQQQAAARTLISGGCIAHRVLCEFPLSSRDVGNNNNNKKRRRSRKDEWQTLPTSRK